MPKTRRLPDCSLGSSYIIGFVRLHDLLDDTLRENGNLNFTQFRLLLKSAEKEKETCLLSELAEMIHLQPNVVSQAANALEGSGLIVRIVSTKDARAKYIKVTDKGREQIEDLNRALKNQLYKTFNPEGDPLYNQILETSILAAAAIETSLSPRFISKHKSSAALITYGIVLERLVDALRVKVDASFNECRMLQRLAEVGQPMRAVDLSLQLALPATTITRAATRLEQRGWLMRLASSANQQAVFLDTTAEGRKQERIILETIDHAADSILWSRLDEKQADAITRVGEVILEQMRAQDGIRRYAVVGELTPIVHES